MFERIQHSQLARAVLQAWQNKLNLVRVLNCAYSVPSLSLIALLMARVRW
jgi:hypothetical protein